MTGTKAFHDLLPQPYRIQKRLALNQSFKVIQQGMSDPDAITYVTFGGEDLYDVMDLVGVYSLRGLSLNVISFEQDVSKAKKSRTCPVAATLSKIESVKINIVRAAFPAGTERLVPLRSDAPFIYFLDYTGTFSARQADAITELLDQSLLQRGDHLLITSCVSPRIVHQEGFMNDHISTYRLYWPSVEVNTEFKAKNHVDLLVAKAFEGYEKSTRGDLTESLVPTLLTKFRYRDSRSPMGLWAYRIESAARGRRLSENRSFDDFPTSFSNVERRDQVPDIFADLR